MKNPLLFLLLLLAPLHVRADNWLENGDFSDGINHWYGEARSAADFAAADPLTPSDPTTSQGMIIPLQPATWKKVCQDFRGAAPDGVLRVTYSLSPGFAFSTKYDDYNNVTHKIGFDAWKPLKIPPGSWLVFVADLVKKRGPYFVIHPTLGTTKMQGFTAPLKALTYLSTKTLTLAIPPGDGMIIIHSATITSQ